MLTDGLKKVVWGLTAVIFSVSAAWAAPSSSSLIKGKSSAEISLERDIGDGITLTCEGVSFEDNAIWVGYTVLSEEDSVIDIGALTDLFDDKGRTVKVPGVNGHRRILIGGNLGNRREIIAGVKTTVAIGYCLRRNYEPPEKYARLSININNKTETFRNVPSTSSEFNVDVYGEKVTFFLPSEPFFEFNGHLYKIFPEGVDWHTAVRRCQEEGGYLCTITSAEECEAIVSNLPPGQDGLRCWLGATDEKQEGQWEWITGEKFDFSWWSPGQPDNSWNEDYLELLFMTQYGGWGWNDIAVAGRFAFICEWE